MSSYVRERILKREIGAGRKAAKPFGLSAGEFVAAFLTLVFFAVVVGYHFYTLKPEQGRLAMLERQLEEQQAQILKEGRTPANETSQRDTIQEALESLETFKGQHLKNRSQGIITLFKDINSIAGKNSVKLTSGISMRDETIGAGGQSGPGSRDSRSLLDQFSSVKMDFTVAGQYQNLRDFISDLERNKQFIIIDSIQLLSVDDIGGGGGGRRAQSAGIALSIGLTAYFQN